ncbi:MAG TPA: amidohydrolase family protein [Chloroflexota bacterium]|nr:amidohydrolase family protein [Chloroflexota bacterium]
MDYDLLIRGGRIIDGSGLPGWIGDVGIKAGKVVELGRLSGSAARTIDAGGLVVSPGFVDHHTHLDAQILWDPYGTSEPENGVTSVVMGNCGLALAPVEDGGEDALVKSFVRVEAMPRQALVEGVPWGWHTYGEYLDTLEGKVGINVGGLCGHIALRQRVLGEESVERESTPAEVQQIKALVREAMEGGALGISTNRNVRHMREDGKPVASRLATLDELFELGDVLGEMNAGVIETIVNLSTEEHIAWYGDLARRTNRPVIWQSVLHRYSAPEFWKVQLETVEPIFRDGARAYGISSTEPPYNRFNLKNAQVFDEWPTFKNVMFLPEVVRKQALRDPDTRAKIKVEMAEERYTNFHKRWDTIPVIAVAKPENEKYLGKMVSEVAAMRGQEPIDALIDLSLEEDLETTFLSATGGDREAMGTIMRSPYVLIGVSDAGAHVQFNAAFGYATKMLGFWVRDRGVMPLEQAIHKLTFQVASIYGLNDRGLLRPGYAADVCIFDPATVNAREPEWVEDYPANTKRLAQKADGIHYTIVNGRVICEDGRLSGDLPGHVLRGAAYAGRRELVAA